jgi:hypothetical protein
MYLGERVLRFVWLCVRLAFENAVYATHDSNQRAGCFMVADYKELASRSKAG